MIVSTLPQSGSVRKTVFVLIPLRRLRNKVADSPAFYVAASPVVLQHRQCDANRKVERAFFSLPHKL